MRFYSEQHLTRPRSWLDTEFVLLDANFRLKLKQRNLEDPPFGGGLAYFVEQEPYMPHVKAAGAQTEASPLLIKITYNYIGMNRSTYAIQGFTRSITRTRGAAVHTQQAALELANADI